jgi:hypothetical protein
MADAGAAGRKSVLLRLDPSVHDALARWAEDEMRSTNAQIEFLLRRALSDSGRGGGRGHLPRRGRPPKANGPEGLSSGLATAGPDEEPGWGGGSPPEP